MDKQQQLEQEEEQFDVTDTTTGLGEGVSNMGGIPVGGGAMAGQSSDPIEPSGAIGSRDTDTGLPIGIGQSSSTGVLPTQGGADLSGTGQGGYSDMVTSGGDKPPYGHSSDQINNPSSKEDVTARYSTEGVDTPESE